MDARRARARMKAGGGGGGGGRGEGRGKDEKAQKEGEEFSAQLKIRNLLVWREVPKCKHKF